MAKTTNTKASAPQLKPAELHRFHAALARWYRTHGRHDLPWRNTRDPYAIWVSEVMLQQTQVATVLGKYYHPFLKRFPTVQALAKAPREAVMKAWEGLGYYRRAGFLHDAARRAAAGVPENYAELVALPGIGRNTAHAVLAFAQRQPVPVLEANVKRVVARIFALEAPKEDALWEGAEALLNRDEPFDYNQAMMDLGAMVCTPKAPQCGICPAKTICAGQTDPESYPTPKARKRAPTREVTLLVLEDAAGKFYLEAREAALLGGLYGFPQAPADATSLRLDGKNIALPKASAGHVTHIYTHFRLEGVVKHVKLSSVQRGWFSPAAIAKLPLSKLDHKLLALIDKSHSRVKKK